MQFADVIVDGEQLFSTDFARHACYTTALLNEVSEEYTKQTGKKLDFTEATKFTKTLVGTSSTDTIWYSLEDNVHGFIKDEKFHNAIKKLNSSKIVDLFTPISRTSKNSPKYF